MYHNRSVFICKLSIRVSCGCLEGVSLFVGTPESRAFPPSTCRSPQKWSPESADSAPLGLLVTAGNALP